MGLDSWQQPGGHSGGPGSGLQLTGMKIFQHLNRGVYLLNISPDLAGPPPLPAICLRLCLLQAFAQGPLLSEVLPRPFPITQSDPIRAFSP